MPGVGLPFTQALPNALSETGFTAGNQARSLLQGSSQSGGSDRYRWDDKFHDGGNTRDPRKGPLKPDWVYQGKLPGGGGVGTGL